MAIIGGMMAATTNPNKLAIFEVKLVGGTTVSIWATDESDAKLKLKRRGFTASSVKKTDREK